MITRNFPFVKEKEKKKKWSKGLSLIKLQVDNKNFRNQLIPSLTALTYAKIIFTLEWSILIALYWAKRCSDTVQRKTYMG